MQSLPQALAPLGAYRQFSLCKYMPDPDRPGKTIKKTQNPYTGLDHDAHDPAIWLDADTALATAAAWGTAPNAQGVWYGIGFTFTPEVPYWFIDVDNCAVPATADVPAHWSPIVAELTALLPGAAVEVSQSLTGLHIFGAGKLGAGPTELRRKKDYTGQLFDLYTEKRFAALTGINVSGDINADCSAGLAVIVARHLVHKGAAPGDAPTEWTTEPDPTWNGPIDDDVLIERMLRSQGANAVFGGRATFRDLWERNTEVLARSYPPDPNSKTSDPYNQSGADRALFQHLAFWTGRDCERMQRLAMRSALVREKWNKRDDYLERTIIGAVAVQSEWLTDKTPEASGATLAASEAPEAKLNTGSTWIGVTEQIEMFKGCVYVSDQNRALVPGGHVIKAEQFRVRYGGYTFPMDNTNEMKPSRDAWEVFTQSQAYKSPRADSSCFRPDLPAAEIISEHDFSMANTYWPIKVDRKVGDVGPFLAHLKKVLPNERDRTILLSYMAACVQYIGFKIKWAPLIQGVEGNGKTFFSLCVAKSVGERYTHWPRADQISEKFNSWLFDKVFIGVEDIFVPESQQEVIEILKPMITGENLAKRAMNTDQVNSWVCCNFILNSNHKGAIRKTRNDRRFAMLFCAQQAESDLVRDGMKGTYMHDLYEWANKGGYAIVAEFLHTYPIPYEFDPKGACQRAPITSSTEEAIGSSMGSIEQEIMEAIEQGVVGFRDGWVSSIALTKLLETRRRNVSPNKQREYLVTLGYDWHPGLKLGRVDNIVLPDGGKPKLFVRRNHPMAGLVGAGQIAAAYSVAQTTTAQISS